MEDLPPARICSRSHTTGEHRQGDQLSRLFWDTEPPVLQTGNSRARWDTLVTLSGPIHMLGGTASVKKSYTTAKKKGPGALDPEAASPLDSAPLRRGEPRVLLRAFVGTWQSRGIEGLSEGHRACWRAGISSSHPLLGALSAALCGDTCHMQPRL